MAQKAVAPVSNEGKRKPVGSRQSFYEQMESIEGVFSGNVQSDAMQSSRDAFFEDFQRVAGSDRTHYIETIQHLPPEVSSKGVEWLKSLVDDLCERTATAVPSLNLFKK